jgi:hypothetical protein
MNFTQFQKWSLIPFQSFPLEVLKISLLENLITKIFMHSFKFYLEVLLSIVVLSEFILYLDQDVIKSLKFFGWFHY